MHIAMCFKITQLMVNLLKFRLYYNKQRNTIHDYMYAYTIHGRSEKQGCRMSDPLQGPPPASRPEARGDNGEGDDESGEDGWTAG